MFQILSFYDHVSLWKQKIAHPVKKLISDLRYFGKKSSITDVLSFSSEDAVHVAENVLTPDHRKTWKTKTAGEDTAFVILQLYKATKIVAITIVNNHSAQIKVLVTRSGLNNKYRSFVPLYTFMNPLESRQGSNVDRVMTFKKEHFNENAAKEKWDRVKIVCFQPFNQCVQFGLTFVVLREGDETGLMVNEASSLGKTCFNKRRKELLMRLCDTRSGMHDARESKKVAVSIREPTAAFIKNPETNRETRLQKMFTKMFPQVSLITPDNEAVYSQKSRNRTELFYDASDTEPHPRINKIIAARDRETDNKDKLKETDKKPETPAKRPSAKPQESRSSHAKKRKSNTRKFYELLGDVTLVVSGIKNPDRAALRSLAMQMGAKYKSNWDEGCTHLICAFANTPKFHQVKSKGGKIVTRKWIEDCYENRRRFPWRRYALDEADRSCPESEDEILGKAPTSEAAAQNQFDEDV